MAERMMQDRMMEREGPMMENREEGGEEATSIFISKEALGNKKCKVGDTLTLKVNDIDPETGDVQADLVGYSHKGGGEDIGSEFDRRMPPSEEAEGEGY